MRSYWIWSVIAAFVLGVGVGRVLSYRASSSVTTANGQTDLAGIERLHKLDERVTVLSDAKALQDEWRKELGEHFSAKTSEPIPCPMMFMASLLPRADNLRFGAGVVCIPNHDPIVVAAEVRAASIT